MPIDANILLQRQPIQLTNPLAQAGQIAQIQGAQQQNQLAQLQFDQAQRGVDESNRLNDVYKNSLNSDGTIDRTKLFSGVSSAGLGSKLLGIQKQFADTDKAKADLGESLAKVQKSKIEQYRDALSNVRTPEQAAQWLQSQYNDPDIGGIMKSHGPYEEIASRIPTTPAEFAQWQQQSALGMTKFIELNKPTFQTRNTGGTTDTLQLPGLGGAPAVVSTIKNTQSPDNAATVAAQIRGQNLTNDRAREQIAQGKVPSGYRANPDGTMVAITGGPADPNIKANKTPTEGERKAATLLQRLEGSQMQLSQALKDNPAAVKPGLLQNGLQSVGLDSTANSLSSSERQRVEAAQLDMLDAALTLGTGAAYTKEQLSGYQKSYFPQIGDKPDTIRDKQARLNNVINAAKIAAGNALGKVDASASTPAAGNDGWSVREVK